LKGIDQDKIRVILATDCGSTTSKARYFQKINGEYRFIASGEAPSTVEAPYEDVTFGVRNAIREVEESVGRKLLTEDGVLKAEGLNEGVDLYVTTSSAGGGLQMIVAGVMGIVTAESAERAALGAGAIVMDVLAVDDGRSAYDKIRRMREMRPDMFLVAGGTDGGTVKHVSEIVELIVAADPKPRLGSQYQLPIVYAGNIDARNIVENTFGKEFALKIVDNIRPTMELENIEPARNSIHELFMEHVMSHAPGYGKLMNWTPVPIMPTPAAEGSCIRNIAEMYKANVLGVGLGGATTNVYSIFEGKFVRTVSANLGMSYSVGNVLKSVGIDNILCWIPLEMSKKDLRHRLCNKMIRPTTIPQTLEDLMVEHAVARGALQLGLQHHKFLARPLHGVLVETGVYRIFNQTVVETYLDMMKIHYVCGTGGLLSHAPRRVQSMLILIDGFQPQGVTRLIQDSVFMMPHLGVLSTIHPKAAMEIFEKDCMVRLGTCIAPTGGIDGKQEGFELAKLTLKMPGGDILKKEIGLGAIARVPLKENEVAEVEIHPHSGFDVGAGVGKVVKTNVEGGVVGIILDGRGRPLPMPGNEEYRRKKLVEWFTAVNAYPGYECEN
jgi:uncharacterized protein (TIGR01319 family)